MGSIEKDKYSVMTTSKDRTYLRIVEWSEMASWGMIFKLRAEE